MAESPSRAGAGGPIARGHAGFPAAARDNSFTSGTLFRDLDAAPLGNFIGTMKRFLPIWIALAWPAAAADERRRETVTLDAPAKFDRQDQTTSLLVADGRHKVNVTWSYTMNDGQTTKLFPVTIEDGRKYQFVIEHERIAGVAARADGALINAQIVTIAEGHRVIYDRAICRVHQKKMERKEVPIIYGLVGRRPGDPSHEEETKLFPFRREVAHGGCIVMPGRDKEMVFVCPGCQAAHAEWAVKNPVK